VNKKTMTRHDVFLPFVEEKSFYVLAPDDGLDIAIPALHSYRLAIRELLSNF
jgi:hypothetical protein